MKLGFDIDGVLASFFEAYERKTVEVTGRDLFAVPATEAAPPHDWDWPQAQGYTNEEMARVWAAIREDLSFWSDLPALPGLDAIRDLYNLNKVDVYFITARPGKTSKAQTEYWLTVHGFLAPTVLISPHKGLMAKALALDVYIEDNLGNAIAVMTQSPTTRTYLLDRPYNKVVNPEAVPELRVVQTVQEMLEAEGLVEEEPIGRAA
jgi:hypothetical protein